MAATLSSQAFTLGYEGKSVADIITQLNSEGVRTVIDVREKALSRKPGFSKKALSVELAKNGIEYVHFPQLGSPSAVRHEYRETGDFKKFSSRYARYASTQSTFLAALVALIQVRRTALLCFEERWDECHRKILCEQLESKGVSFSHL
jgi:uncharacterized protein (DUF488 family)